MNAKIDAMASVPTYFVHKTAMDPNRINFNIIACYDRNGDLLGGPNETRNPNCRLIQYAAISAHVQRKILVPTSAILIEEFEDTQRNYKLEFHYVGIDPNTHLEKCFPNGDNIIFAYQ